MSGVNLEQIQEYMRMQSEADKKNRTITVEAPSIPEGLKQASIELGVPLSALEYEVVARGSVRARDRGRGLPAGLPPGGTGRAGVRDHGP